jgi:hypothetical protein
MKTTLLTAALLAALALGTWSQAGLADTAEAMCEVRKDGENKKNASGPCDFSQRQGYVSINLRNGDSFELRPGDKANHFKDQKGNKVVRTVTGANTQEYKWDGKKITVTFVSGASSGAAYAPSHGGTPADLGDLVGAKAGQAEGELQRRGYEYRSGSTSGNAKYSTYYNASAGRCVMIRTEEGRYQSIVDAPMADCERR